MADKGDKGSKGGPTQTRTDLGHLSRRINRAHDEISRLHRIIQWLLLQLRCPGIGELDEELQRGAEVNTPHVLRAIQMCTHPGNAAPMGPYRMPDAGPDPYIVHAIRHLAQVQGFQDVQQEGMPPAPEVWAHALHRSQAAPCAGMPAQPASNMGYGGGVAQVPTQVAAPNMGYGAGVVQPPTQVAAPNMGYGVMPTQPPAQPATAAPPPPPPQEHQQRVPPPPIPAPAKMPQEPPYPPPGKTPPPHVAKGSQRPPEPATPPPGKAG